MNEYRVSPNNPDWWSRLIAIGSLLIASAALYYSYLNETRPSLPSTDQVALNQTDPSPAGESVSPGSADPNSPPGVANPEPGTVATGNDSEPDASSSIDWQSLKADTSPSLRQDNTSTANNTLDGEIDDVGDSLIDKPFSKPIGISRLTTVSRMMKPTTDAEHVTALIANTGDGAASVQELVFHPKSVEALPENFARRVDWSLTDDQHLVVRFDEDDNHTSTKGRHGDYARELQVPFVIDPDARVELKLLLENPDHVGYGLVGSLTLRLSNGEKFEIDQVAIPFVEPE